LEAFTHPDYREPGKDVDEDNIFFEEDIEDLITLLIKNIDNSAQRNAAKQGCISVFRVIFSNLRN